MAGVCFSWIVLDRGGGCGGRALESSGLHYQGVSHDPLPSPHFGQCFFDCHQSLSQCHQCHNLKSWCRCGCAGIVLGRFRMCMLRPGRSISWCVSFSMAGGGPCDPLPLPLLSSYHLAMPCADLLLPALLRRTPGDPYSRP